MSMTAVAILAAPAAILCLVVLGLFKLLRQRPMDDDDDSATRNRRRGSMLVDGYSAHPGPAPDRLPTARSVVSRQTRRAPCDTLVSVLRAIETETDCCPISLAKAQDIISTVNTIAHHALVRHTQENEQ